MNPNFNRIAAFYYPLSRLVFGNKQFTAQTCFLHLINPGSKILIVGGGNGRILDPLLKSTGRYGSITFVESSSAMIAMAQKRVTGTIPVHFINTTIEEFLAADTETYDAVLTGFFFDLFPQQHTEDLHSLLTACLVYEGLWIDTDFQNDAFSPLWQKLLLKTMYEFFQKVSTIRASTLSNLEGRWESDFTLICQRTFYCHFIKTRAWRKHSLPGIPHY